MDTQDAAYTQARTDGLGAMLRAGAFDMPDHRRREFVAVTVRALAGRYPARGEAQALFATALFTPSNACASRAMERP